MHDLLARYFPQDCNSVVAQSVLEAVRISLAGYPTGRTYVEFVDRFGFTDGPTSRPT
jgi:hypothetical protein